MNMVDVRIDHTGLPAPIDSLSTWANIDGTKSWDEIKEIIVKSVGDRFGDLLFMYTYFITLIDTDGRKYSLDDDLTRKKTLLNTNGPNLEVKKLKVIWSLKNNTGPTESIAKNDASTQTDSQFQTTDPCIFPQDFVEFLNFCNELKTDQTEIPDNVSIEDLLKGSADPPPTLSPIQQTNSTPTSSSSEEHLNQTEGQDNGSVVNQSQFSVKRANQSKGGTNAKKRRKRTNKQNQSLSSSQKKMKMMNTYITKDKKPEFNETDYESSSVPVIFTFAKDKMIQFKDDIDQIKKLRYFHEEYVPCIQYKKAKQSEVVNKSKESILPVIELPLAYKHQNLVLMAFTGVKEYQKVMIGGKEGIEFCNIGYQKFKSYSVENEEMWPMSVIYPDEKDEKAGQLIFQITPVSDGKNEYTLIAHSFQMKNMFKEEIGPVMFRLSAEYIEAACKGGFKFDREGLTHRYVAYLFKFNEQSNRYEPDFETLVLSDYMFYDSNKKKKNQQNDALQN